MDPAQCLVDLLHSKDAPVLEAFLASDELPADYCSWARTADDTTFLTYAALESSVACMCVLLEAGVLVSDRDDDSDDLFRPAIVNGDVYVVILLLRAGAVPSVHSLRAAVTHGNLAVFHTICDAMVHPRNHLDFYVALIDACNRDDAYVAAYIFDCMGPGIAQSNLSRSTPIIRIAMAHPLSLRVLRVLVHKCIAVDLFRFDRYDVFAALVAFTTCNDGATVGALLRAGVPPDAPSPGCLGPLRVACRQLSLDLVVMLLDAGADLGDVYDNVSILREAVANCRCINGIRLVRLLLERGANPRDTVTSTRPDCFVPSTLSLVAHRNNCDLLHAFLGTGAFDDAGDDMLEDALRSAVHAGSIDVIRVLLARGVSPNVYCVPHCPFPGPRTCLLMSALRRGACNIGIILIDAGASASACAHCDIPHIHGLGSGMSRQSITLLIANGADVNATIVDESRSALRFAIWRICMESGDCGPLRCLVEAGVDVASPSACLTIADAIDCFMARDLERVISILVDAGCDFDGVQSLRLSPAVTATLLAAGVPMRMPLGGDMRGDEAFEFFRGGVYDPHPSSAREGSYIHAAQTLRAALVDALTPYIDERYVAEIVGDCVYIPAGRRRGVYETERREARASIALARKDVAVAFAARARLEFCSIVRSD